MRILFCIEAVLFPLLGYWTSFGKEFHPFFFPIYPAVRNLCQGPWI